jgi:hypothetical protein
MRIVDEFRGRGLSSLFMAIWLQLCLHMGLAPRANRIDKPLICQSLHKFGFRPCVQGGQGGNGRKRGIDVKLTRGSGENAGKLVLSSPTGKDLRSTFTAHELHSQGLVLAPVTPKAAAVCSEEEEEEEEEEDGGNGRADRGGRARDAGGGGEVGTTGAVIRLKVAFDGPADMRQLQERVSAQFLRGGGGGGNGIGDATCPRLILLASPEVLRIAFFGGVPLRDGAS